MAALQESEGDSVTVLQRRVRGFKGDFMRGKM